MKRSEINAAIRRARTILRASSLALPAWADWSLAQWEENAPKLTHLKRAMLGWDVTDFGSGDFPHCGSVLFTVRNGRAGDPSIGTPYAEKLILQLCETEQEIPYHYHSQKTEDIINRGGGLLLLQLYHAADDGAPDKEREIRVRMDGVDRVFAPGEVVEVPKGCSITLYPRLFHRFWAKKGAGDLIVGEVSSINDDATDNAFLEDRPRFAAIEEDEPPLCPLCNEYR